MRFYGIVKNIKNCIDKRFLKGYTILKIENGNEGENSTGRTSENLSFGAR